MNVSTELPDKSNNEKYLKLGFGGKLEIHSSPLVTASLSGFMITMIVRFLFFIFIVEWGEG